jgi:hypothetical protein
VHIVERPAHSFDNGKTNPDKVASLPKRVKVAMPLEIVMSLLQPDELEKLQKYIAAYRKHWQQ